MFINLHDGQIIAVCFVDVNCCIYTQQRKCRRELPGGAEKIPRPE